MAAGEWKPEWLTNIFHIGDLHTAMLLQRFNETSSPCMSEETREGGKEGGKPMYISEMPFYIL